MSDVAHRLHCYTFRQYLELEETSNVRHEFLAGEIYAMAGGTPDHAALAMSVGAALLAKLPPGNCRVHGSDLRIRVLPTGLATYPDVTVVCGSRELDPQGRTTVVNPRLIVEVLSDSTEAYDRGQKFEHYQQIASLTDYLLVSHRTRRLELWQRGEDGRWALAATAGTGQRVRLSLGCELTTEEVYRQGLELD